MSNFVKTFMQMLEEKLMPIAQNFSQQRHMSSIRQGLVATMPLTIVGSFFTVTNNLPLEGYTNFIAPYLSILDIPFRLTVGSLALYASFSIGACLARSYKLDPISGGLLATVSFLLITITPIRLTADTASEFIAAGRYLNIASLSSQSLFGGIVAALGSVEIYHLCKKYNLTIKMPAGVPPEVENSFAALIPFLFSILLFWIIRHVLNFDLNGTISTVLMPLKDILSGNSLFGGLLTVFLITFFWTLGIHGPAIMGPVIRPIWDMTIAENMDAFMAGASANALPNLFTEQFLQWFLWIGGSGATLPLVCLFLASKSKYLKSLGRLSIVPGVFNINEPVIFGAPIVMNPILAIPFIVAPLVMTVVAYLFTQSGLVPMMMARITFTFPAPIAAWMSTNWSWMAAVLVIINFFIALIIYYPFFKILENQEIKKEAEATNETQEN